MKKKNIKNDRILKEVTSGIRAIKKVTVPLEERELLNKIGVLLAELYQFLGGIYVGKYTKEANEALSYMDALTEDLGKLDDIFDDKLNSKYDKSLKVFLKKRIKFYEDEYKAKQEDKDARIYPCDKCGKLRSQNEGGTCFSVCDDCWED